jgi:hypothetical protein
MATTISSTRPAVKWGLFYTIVAIIITYLFQILNVDITSSAKYISYIPFIAFLLLAQKEYKDQLDGYLTFGEGFLTGFKYSVITGVLGALFTYIYFTLLSPQVYQTLLDGAKAKMESQGNVTDDQMDMALKIMSPGIICAFAVIGSLIFGSIVSLIGAAIFKKDKPPFITDVPYTDPTV